MSVMPSVRSRLVPLLALATLLALPTAAHAATFTVTITGDFLTGGCDTASCSLREAITAANASGADDTVVIPAGSYTLSIAGTGEDANVDGDLDVAPDGTGGHLTIVGAGVGKTTIVGDAPERVLDVHSNTFTMRDLTITGGDANAPGAGVHLDHSTGTLTRIRVTANDANGQSGAGIYFEGGTNSITDSTVDANLGGRGAGLFLDSNGTLTAARLDVSNNQATAAASNAGGLFVDGNTTATVTDSTFYGNKATLNGGGIELNTNANAIFKNITVVGNTSDTDNNGFGEGGGIYAEGTGHVSIGNSILSANRKRTDGAASTENCNISQGTYSSLGHNLVDNTTACAVWVGTDTTGVSPALKPYASYGGSSKVLRPSATSPAINAGSGALCAGRTLDQRGFKRTIGATCDIGAAEAGARVDLAVTGRSKVTLHLGKTTAYTFKLANRGPDAALGARLKIKLPKGLRGKASGPGLRCKGTTTITCTVKATALEGGTTISIKVKLKPSRTSLRSIAATASQLGLDPVKKNNVRKVKPKVR